MFKRLYNPYSKQVSVSVQRQVAYNKGGFFLRL